LKIVLIKAAETGVKFRVIVADSRPKLEGREMVRHLVNAGIHSTYIHVSAVAHIIKEVRVTRIIDMFF
jgi:translation initiation factor eIF-2B subunit delta